MCAARLTRTEINVYVEGKLGIALKDTELQRRGMELSKANDRGQWHYVVETEYQALPQTWLAVELSRPL